MRIHKRADKDQERFGPLKDFMTMFFQLVPNWLTVATVEQVKSDWDFFSKEIGKLFDRYRFIPLRQTEIEFWARFYRIYFPEIKLELSNLEVLNNYDRRVLIVAEGLTEALIWEALKNTGMHIVHASDFYFDRKDSQNERHPKDGTYAISLLDHESSKEILGRQPDELRKSKRPAQTLLEYLLHVLVYYHEKQRILGMQRGAVCSGTWYDEGDENFTVPIVFKCDSLDGLTLSTIPTRVFARKEERQSRGVRFLSSASSR